MTKFFRPPGWDTPPGWNDPPLELCLDCKMEISTEIEEERGYCVECREVCVICRELKKIEEGFFEDDLFVCMKCLG